MLQLKITDKNINGPRIYTLETYRFRFLILTPSCINCVTLDKLFKLSELTVGGSNACLTGLIKILKNKYAKFLLQPLTSRRQ